MKRLNLPLITGGIMLVLILAVIIMPGVFTGKSPYNMQQLRFFTENGKLIIEKAPYPPSAAFLLGSDDMGRDIYSYIIYGTRLTILLGVLAALARFLIALPLSLSAGFGSSVAKSIIKQFGIIFSAIPALLICIIVLQLDFFGGLDKRSSMIAFIMVLSVVGWPKIAGLMMERVDAINRQPFIKGEVAIGKKRLRIALENIFPHLAPEMIVLFFMEIARSLSMIMQLGIFSIFIGNLKFIVDTEGGITFFDIGFEPEWAGMLSSSRNMISVAPWAVLFPALAFFISVLAFNLFGEGLRMAMQEKDSRIVPMFRKIISPDIKSIFAIRGKKTRQILVIAIAVLILAFTVPAMIGNSRYEFEYEEDEAIPYDRVIAGTPDAKKTAEIIADRMSKLGLEPLFKEGYEKEYELGDACLIKNHSFELILKTGTIYPEINKDFRFLLAGDLEYSSKVTDLTNEDMFGIVSKGVPVGDFVLMDKSFYNDAAISYFIDGISNKTNATGFILIDDKDMAMEGAIAQYDEDKVVISVTRELGELIKNSGGAEVRISTTVELLGTTGLNISGIRKGADPYAGGEALIIGMGYNYLNKEGSSVLDFNLELMERLCSDHDIGRSLIFMFFDGTVSTKLNGIFPMSADFPYSPAKVKLFIDLTGISRPEFDVIGYSSKQAPFTRTYAWSIGHMLEQEFGKNKLEFAEPESINVGREYYFTDNEAHNVMFWEKGIASIIIRTDEAGGGGHDISEIGSMLLKAINISNY
ncbi:MAG: ABC transporter permease [Clostridia bacterium]|nr:ABC transporter permease [Clostridia bacterium]